MPVGVGLVEEVDRLSGHENVLAAVVHAVAPDRRGQTADYCNESSVGQVFLDRRSLPAPHVDVDQRRLSRDAIIDGESDPDDRLLVDQSRYGIGVEAPDERDGIHGRAPFPAPLCPRGVARCDEHA